MGYVKVEGREGLVTALYAGFFPLQYALMSWKGQERIMWSRIMLCKVVLLNLKQLEGALFVPADTSLQQGSMKEWNLRRY